MITVYKDSSDFIKPTEFAFKEKLCRFDTESSIFHNILMYMEGSTWDGKNLITRFGKGMLNDLMIATKLALLMWVSPSEMFNTYGCSDQQMEKLLNLPDGTILLDREKPFSYYFTCKVRTDAGHVVTNSSELNSYLFKGRMF